MFAVPGPFGPPVPPLHPPRSHEEGASCARDRRRVPSILAPDPCATPACRPGLGLAPVAGAAQQPRRRRRDARRRGAGRRADVGDRALRTAAERVRRRRARTGRPRRARRARHRGGAAHRRPGRRADAAGPAQAFNPRHTFEQFVIGDSNRLAHAAALAVAEMPGLAYNPLFICGAPGLGKSHLLHSIGNYVTAYGGGATVRYTTAEAFTNHFLGALHGHDTERFKAAYRGVDVLLVDDVQFLQAKARTEQEFFHTFNALHQSGAQIVLTSDRLPRDLGELEARLRERFEAGLVTDVRAPDPATRLTILRKRVQQDGIAIPDPAALAAHRGPRRRQRARARGRADPRRRLRVAHRPPRHRRADRGGPRRPLPRPQGSARTRSPSTRSRRAPPRRSGSPSRRSSRRAAPAPWHGRARSRCTSRAS